MQKLRLILMMKSRIIPMTANLVKTEIREKHYSMGIYPNSRQIKQLD